MAIILKVLGVSVPTHVLFEATVSVWLDSKTPTTRFQLAFPWHFVTGLLFLAVLLRENTRFGSVRVG